MSEPVKGFIAEVNDLVYYTDGRDVYRASKSSVADVRTGFLIGRWECSLDHFKRYAETVYSITLPEGI